MKRIFRKNLICLLLIMCIELYSAKLSSLRIRNVAFSKCDPDANYPISTENIHIQLGGNKEFFLSGSFATNVDVTAPIMAKVIMNRKFGFWMPIPCHDEIGSCTYTDLCSYGYSINEECPSRFKENNIPCRCPISKGNYTLPEYINMLSNKSIWAGKYKGSMEVLFSNELLLCYNFKFEMYNPNSWF